MPFTLAQKYISLGVPTPISIELARQIGASSYNWKRLAELGMVPDLAKYTANSLQAGTFNPVTAMKLTMTRAQAALTKDNAGGGGGGSFSPFVYQSETNTLVASQTAVSDRRKKSKDRAIARIKSQAGSAWAKLIGLYLIDDTEANFLKNWKTPGTFDLTKVVTPTFTSNDGVTTTSNGQYFETGIPLLSLPQDSFSIGVFSNTSTAVASVEFGAQDASAVGISFNPRSTSNFAQARIMSAIYTSPVTSFWNGLGWYGLTRAGSTTAFISHDGYRVETVSTPSATPSTNPTIRLLGAAGNTGFSARKLSGFYVTNAALTENEELMLTVILRDYIDKVRFGDIDVIYPGFGDAQVSADVVVFGSSPAAWAAARTAKREGRSVVWAQDWVAETEWDIGGVKTSGLTFIDANDPTKVNGEFRDLLSWVNTGFYSRADTSTQFQLSPESRAIMQGIRRSLDPTRTGGTMPGMDIPVYFTGGIQSIVKTGTRATQLIAKDGRKFNCRVLIGADYDGQGVKEIGAPYTIGTEAQGAGGENINGFILSNRYKPFGGLSIDPYVTPATPASGLLPDMEFMPTQTSGTPDAALQSMNYRLLWSNTKTRLFPFESSPPPNYNPLRYEVIGRAFALNPSITISQMFKIDGIGIGTVYDVNNGSGGISTDLKPSGLNYGLATNDAGRKAVADDVLDFIRGLIYWFLYSNDSRIPAGIKTTLQSYSLDPTSFLDPRSGRPLFWPGRHYARDPVYQMVNTFLYNGVDLKVADGTTPRSTKTVAIGNYNIVDRHAPRQVAYDAGDGMYVYVQGSAGDTSYAGTDKVNPIPMEVLFPEKAICTNFLTPTAPAMTKIPWYMDRMEPTLSQMGQACGLIAAMACEANIDVQDVDYSAFRTRMLAQPNVVPPILPQVN